MADDTRPPPPPPQPPPTQNHQAGAASGGDEAEQEDTESLGNMDMFADPPNFYPPPPPPRTDTHTLASGAVLTLHLVGHSVMDAHHVWNGGRVLADYFEADPGLVRDKTVLELGAGAGIPSLVASSLGARAVVATDYPDEDVLVSLRRNVAECAVVPHPKDRHVVVAGYAWGRMVEPLMRDFLAPMLVVSAAATTAGPPRPRTETADSDDATAAAATAQAAQAQAVAAAQAEAAKGFDVVIMADLLFRHTEHAKLVQTLEGTLKRSRASRAFVFFTSYRPWLRERDLRFFDVVRERGFLVEQVLERKMDKVLFEDDPGDEETRRTCGGYVVRWPGDKCLD